MIRSVIWTDYTGAAKKNGFDVNKITVGLPVMRQLAAVMRNENWNITATIVQRKYSSEILHVEPGIGHEKSLGLAVDIGTTSVVVYLVDMADGAILAATSAHNRQAACGDDVINRIEGKFIENWQTGLVTFFWGRLPHNSGLKNSKKC